jgi:hypothetical protein
MTNEGGSTDPWSKHRQGLEASGILTRRMQLGDWREGLSSQGLSAGVLEILNKGRIAWINCRPSESDDMGTYMDFMIPDERLQGTDVSHFVVDSVVRRWHLFGRKLRWRGRDCGLAILAALNGAPSLEPLWLKPNAPAVRIFAHSGRFCGWRLAVDIPNTWWRAVIDTDVERWRIRWICLDSLAQVLLDAPLKTSPVLTPDY